MAKKSRNVFTGADDIYQTRSSIAVRRVSSRIAKDGTAQLRDKTKYYPKTTEKMNQAKQVFGPIRWGRS